MFGLHALRRLFTTETAAPRNQAATLEQLLGGGTVAIVSAACCDAMSTPRDEELAQNLCRALEATGLQRGVEFGTLTSTRQQLRARGLALDAATADFRDQLAAVFQAHGLAAFPLLLIEGRIAFYGGVPTAQAIADRLSRHPAQTSAPA